MPRTPKSRRVAVCRPGPRCPGCRYVPDPLISPLWLRTVKVPNGVELQPLPASLQDSASIGAQQGAKERQKSGPGLEEHQSLAADVYLPASDSSLDQQSRFGRYPPQIRRIQADSPG